MADAPQGTLPTRREDPPVVINFSKLPGVGKSVNMIASWAGAPALFIAGPGGLRGDYHALGIDVSAHVRLVYNLEQAIELLPWAAHWGYRAVGIDDVSLLAQTTTSVAEKHYTRIGKSGEEYLDKAMWSYMGGLMQTLVDTTRQLGLPVEINAHYQPSFNDNKTREFFPAGPNFGWKKLVLKTPFIADLVQYAIPRPPGAPEWDTRCNVDTSDASTSTKDRFGFALREGSPLNTAELLRAAGLGVARPVGLEWMEEPVELLAQDIAAGMSEKDARAKWREKLIAAGVKLELSRWVIRDGVHRARFRMGRRTRLLGDL